MALNSVDYIGAAIETPWEKRADLRERRWWRIQRIERKERRQQARAAMRAISDLSVADFSHAAELERGTQ